MESSPEKGIKTDVRIRPKSAVNSPFPKEVPIIRGKVIFPAPKNIEKRANPTETEGKIFLCMDFFIKSASFSLF